MQQSAFERLLKKEAMGKKLTFAERNLLKMERKKIEQFNKEKEKLSKTKFK
jgi:hypothetical protein